MYYLHSFACRLCRPETRGVSSDSAEGEGGRAMEESHGPRESSLLQLRQDQQHRLHGQHDGRLQFTYCMRTSLQSWVLQSDQLMFRIVGHLFWREEETFHDSLSGPEDIFYTLTFCMCMYHRITLCVVHRQFNFRATIIFRVTYIENFTLLDYPTIRYMIF